MSRKPDAPARNVPFIAYLCSLLRTAEGPDGWLAGTALALWTLLASVHLLRRTWRKPAPAAATGTAGAMARA